MDKLPSKTIQELLEDASLDDVTEAICAEMKRLMPTINVEKHPGKIDISDVVEKSITKTPSIMIGWGRMRPVAETAAHYGAIVDFIAYIVVEDYSDLVIKKRISRDQVGKAIGSYIFQALHHNEHDTWGLKNIKPPEKVPAPEFKPVFTASSYTKGVAYYAVTWSQQIIDNGSSIATDGPLFDSDTGDFAIDNLDPDFLAIFNTTERSS